MAVKASRSSVGSTATVLNTVDTGGVAGSGVALKNLSNVTVYIGGSDVSTTNGYPVEAGAEMSVDFESSGEVLYGIVASGTAQVAVLRAGA